MSSEEVFRTLGRIEAQNNLILDQLREHQQERKELKDKVDKIEKKINYAAGGVAAGSILLSVFLSPFLAKLGLTR